MIIEPGRKRRAPEDDSFIGVRIGVLLMVAGVLFAVLVFRLWYLQILTGDTYAGLANNNRVREVVVEAPRGVIYDRTEKVVLVQNRAGLSVGLLTMDMPNPKKEKTQFDAEMSKLSVLLDMTEADLLNDYTKAAKSPYTTFTIKEDVPENPVVTYLKEHNTEFPGVEVDKSYLRSYPNRSLAAQLLGYVGEVSANDLDQPQFKSLVSGSTVGKDGVERTYDSQLRGTDGEKTYEVDSAGNAKQQVGDVSAKPGNNLVLTIDSELQKAAENAITDGIQRAYAQGFKKAAGGAVVALDPNTGQVLAMASYPSYDPTLWVGGMNASKYAELTNTASHNPLFNRAMNGLYPAGSTFKPFVAAAALSAGVITPDTMFTCNGRFSVASQTWKCWKSGGHGNVTLLKAIEQSCDVYFYNVGNLMFSQTGPVLQNGLRLFGFGRSTGIDLPGETTGSRVPDSTWKAQQGKTAVDKIWKTGDDVNLAIGQGDLLVTPLQMAVALSALVNGGTVYVPQLAYKITDSKGNTIHEYEPEKRSELEISPTILNTIKQGMQLVTMDPSGTAYSTFRGFSISVGGKTGTAQKKPDDDYALFMGYAPADNPKIVVFAIIEQGGHGSSVAAPVVRKVMEQYFHTTSGSSVVQPVTE